jgi:hypothetical protein
MHETDVAVRREVGLLLEGLEQRWQEKYVSGA